MNVFIRKLAGDEVKTALSLAWEVFQEYEAPDYSEEGVQDFHKSICDPQWISRLDVYGAFENGQLAGMIASRNNKSHIALFFVKGTYHQLGIGRKLFEVFLSNSPAQEITVNSSPYAVSVYHKLGFEDTDIEQTTNGIRYIPMKMKR